MYESRLPFEAISEGPLGTLHAAWRQAHQTRRALPVWHSLGAVLTPSLVRRTNLLAVRRSQSGFRFVWRRHGADGVMVHGTDRTGKDTSSLQPFGYRELVERHFRECAMTGAPTLYEIESVFDHHVRPQYYRRLLLPFASDGHVADMLLTAWDTGSPTRAPRLDQDLFDVEATACELLAFHGDDIRQYLAEQIRTARSLGDVLSVGVWREIATAVTRIARR